MEGRQAVQEAMGTRILHRAYGRNAEKALKAAGKEMARLEQLLSRFRPGSDVGRINRSAGLKPEYINQETFDLLSLAKAYSLGLGGSFDITVGPLMDLWDYKHASAIPEDATIKSILPLVDASGLILDERKHTAMLIKKGQAIDLGAIGKGYASDRIMDVFRAHGIASAFTNIGGNVSTLGGKPDGSPWRVGIRHPRGEKSLLGAVSVAGKAVVTSGDYERFFIDREGKRRHHILDPGTGYPGESGLISVTVVADSAVFADALSTALFVAGMEKGLGCLSRYPGADAILVDENLAAYVTPGLSGSFWPEGGIAAEILH